ncbi:MAG: GNAT family N-acetyltransferase [Chitinophagaceae bacterium]
MRRETFTWVDPEEFRLMDFDDQTEGEQLMVARVDGRVAGFISLWKEDDFIHHLYVDRRYQGQGVGAELLKAGYRKLGPVARLKCLVNNIRAIRFYERQGFIEMGRGGSEHGDYILFEKLNRPRWINFF